jgi:hypothetical protein
MTDSLRVHQYPLRDGIRPTPEFAKKKLAQFSANVGVKCGHGCTYCSSGALLRCHAGFKQAGESPFKHGYCIIDPEIPQKVALDAARRRNRGMVQLCTTGQDMGSLPSHSPSTEVVTMSQTKDSVVGKTTHEIRDKLEQLPQFDGVHGSKWRPMTQNRAGNASPTSRVAQRLSSTPACRIALRKAGYARSLIV